MTEPLKTRLQEDVKIAMKAKERARLGVIRLIMSAIKQREVDERIVLDDAQIVEVLSRMLKQRRDSFKQYTDAGRQDLADQEAFEINLIQDYLPPPLDDTAIATLIDEVIVSTGATSPRDMGKVMAQLKPQIQGRADLGQVSALVKARFQG